MRTIFFIIYPIPCPTKKGYVHDTCTSTHNEYTKTAIKLCLNLLCCASFIIIFHFVHTSTHSLYTRRRRRRHDDDDDNISTLSFFPLRCAHSTPICTHPTTLIITKYVAPTTSRICVHAAIHSGIITTVLGSDIYLEIVLVAAACCSGCTFDAVPSLVGKIIT